MKNILFIFSTASLLVCNTTLFCQTTNNIEFGRYLNKKDSEVLLLNEDYTFTISEVYGENASAVVPHCNKNLAEGQWKIKNNNLYLVNYEEFNRINYSVNESFSNSSDTLYIKIKIPEDEAFFEGKFRYQIKPFASTYSENKKGEFAIPRNKTFRKNGSFSLLIQDLYPTVKNDKCFHKIYFQIFKNHIPKDKKNNTFSIFLPRFDQCFVESYVIKNEILYVDENKGIHWDDRVFILHND